MRDGGCLRGCALVSADLAERLEEDLVYPIECEEVRMLEVRAHLNARQFPDSLNEG